MEPIPFKTAEQCIHHRFDDIAKLFPDRPAVSDKNHSLTYAELQKESNKLAYQIQQLLGKGKGNIALLIENNVYQIIAILGILKAGRSYVALDTTFPDDRNISILEDAECKILISTSGHKKVTENIGRNRFLLRADELSENQASEEAADEVSPTDNAITLYTSGSTGKPKGVLQSHRNMVHFIKRMSEEHAMLPGDKVAYFFSVGFSAHALPLLGALLNGCELKTYNFKSGNFYAYSQWLRNSKISFVMMIPSFMRHFLAVQEKSDRYPDIRLLYSGGETLYRSDVEKARKVFSPETIMINIYASTEAYIMRSFTMRYNTSIKSNIVPIGYPVQDMKINLVDKNGKSTEGNSIGEIILESEYLTEGYHNRPELQAQDFKIASDGKTRIFNTSDIAYKLEGDCMVHVGRRDSVIKLRGNRIDFGEIINILLSGNNIKEATCALKINPQGVDHIIAYIVAVEGTEPDMELMQALLVRMLPGYMIPTQIITLEELPKSNVGKIDVQALQEPEWGNDAAEEKELPSGETEIAIAEIFTKTLKIPSIGTNENLLKIGADSLSLFVAFSEIEKQFGIKLDIQNIMNTLNIRSIADHIESIRQL